MHPVICIYCRETFDRDKEPFAQVSARRYAHKKCYDTIQKTKSKIERDYEELENYIKVLFGIEQLTNTIIRQIKKYREEYHYSYTGILKTLKWWYEIKKKNIEDGNWGISIVPYIYNEALEYYKGRFFADENNKKIDLEHYQPKIEIVTIPSPQIQSQPPQLFSLLEERKRDGE